MQELVICMVWNGSGHEDMREMSVMMKMSGQAIWRDEESGLQRCRCRYSGDEQKRV